MQLIGPSEAEDLTQEVFIKVGNALISFRNESKISTWIYRIATNTAIDKMRKSALQREETEVPHAMDKGGSQSCNYSSIEDQVIHKDTNECIRGIIEKLPDNYRLILILSELEGLRNKEIAEILGIDINVVKIRVHRGKARLKKELLKSCSFSWDERNEFTCDPKRC
jgi:RNA polymerase sigma-70 factor (ECF subfamily)